VYFAALPRGVFVQLLELGQYGIRGLALQQRHGDERVVALDVRIVHRGDSGHAEPRTYVRGLHRTRGPSADVEHRRRRLRHAIDGRVEQMAIDGL